MYMNFEVWRQDSEEDTTPRNTVGAIFEQFIKQNVLFEFIVIQLFNPSIFCRIACDKKY